MMVAKLNSIIAHALIPSTQHTSLCIFGFRATVKTRSQMSRLPVFRLSQQKQIAFYSMLHMHTAHCMLSRFIFTFFIMLVIGSVRSLGLRLRRTSVFVKPSRTLRMHTDDALSADVETGSAIPQNFKSSFLQEMLDRGFIHQCTDFKTLDERMSSGVVTAYLVRNLDIWIFLLAYNRFLSLLGF